MNERSGIPDRRVKDLLTRENSRFVGDHPLSVSLRERARSSMPRGVPMSWMETFTSTRRYRLAKWQFTLSATQANTEVIRLARHLTGREVVPMRELTRAHGRLLALDETHSLVGAYGGMSGELGLEPDLFAIGKSIAAGVPLGAYGMTEQVADLIAPPAAHNLASGLQVPEIATGGTLFANAFYGRGPRGAVRGLDAGRFRARPRPWDTDGGRSRGRHCLIGYAVECAPDGHARVLRFHADAVG